MILILKSCRARYGQLGHGSRQNELNPVRVHGALKGLPAVQLACGANHTLALTATGLVFAVRALIPDCIRSTFAIGFSGNFFIFHCSVCGILFFRCFDWCFELPLLHMC